MLHILHHLREISQLYPKKVKIEMKTPKFSTNNIGVHHLLCFLIYINIYLQRLSKG